MLFQRSGRIHDDDGAGAERRELRRRMRSLRHLGLRQADNRAAEISVDRAERVDDVFGQGERHRARGRLEFPRTTAPRADIQDGVFHVFLWIIRP